MYPRGPASTKTCCQQPTTLHEIHWEQWVRIGPAPRLGSSTALASESKSDVSIARQKNKKCGGRSMRCDATWIGSHQVVARRKLRTPATRAVRTAPTIASRRHGKLPVPALLRGLRPCSSHSGEESPLKSHAHVSHARAMLACTRARSLTDR